jgi:hypothetical protein
MNSLQKQAFQKQKAIDISLGRKKKKNPFQTCPFSIYPGHHADPMKTPLTLKQIAARAASRRAKQARKLNRK